MWEYMLIGAALVAIVGLLISRRRKAQQELREALMRLEHRQAQLLEVIQRNFAEDNEEADPHEYGALFQHLDQSQNLDVLDALSHLKSGHLYERLSHLRSSKDLARSWEEEEVGAPWALPALH